VPSPSHQLGGVDVTNRVKPILFANGGPIVCVTTRPLMVR